METKSVIIGMGEVGSALYEILSEQYNVVGVDLEHWRANFEYDDSQAMGTEVMHICFPYSESCPAGKDCDYGNCDYFSKHKKGFVDLVHGYQRKYRPNYTVIHSTVPVGTSRKCGAVHSPIRGIHPNLAGGIRTFVKFLGGENASGVADYFRRAGLKIMLVDKPETTEAGKLFDTEYYRSCIEFMHRVMAYCVRSGLNFHEVYTLFNQTYNEGYEKLDHPEYCRPVLQPIAGQIGGHCVMPNKSILEKDINN